MKIPFLQKKKSPTSSLERTSSSSSSLKSTSSDAVVEMSQEIQPVNVRNWIDSASTNGKTANSSDVASTSSSPSSSYDGDKELADTFEVFDRNGDGKISFAELKEVLRSLEDGLEDKSSEDDLRQMFQAADTDGDGYIDLEEFISLNRAVDGAGSSSRSEELRAAFRVFDINNNNYISADELHQVLCSLDRQSTLTLEECRRMIDGVDSNNDGQVDFQEFERMMTDNWVC